MQPVTPWILSPYNNNMSYLCYRAMIRPVTKYKREPLTNYLDALFIKPADWLFVLQ